MSSHASSPSTTSFLDRLHADAEKRGYQGPIPDHRIPIKIFLDLVPFVGPTLTHGAIQRRYEQGVMAKDIEAQLRAECEHLLVLMEFAIDSFITVSPIMTEIAHTAVVILTHLQRMRTSLKHLVLNKDPLLPIAEFLLRHPHLRTLNQQALRAPIPNIAEYVSEARTFLSDVLCAIPPPSAVFAQWEKRQRESRSSSPHVESVSISQNSIDR